MHSLPRHWIVSTSHWSRVNTEGALWSRRIRGNFTLTLTLDILNKLLLGHLVKVLRWWGCVAGSLVLYSTAVIVLIVYRSLSDNFVSSIAHFLESWLAFKAAWHCLVCCHSLSLIRQIIFRFRFHFRWGSCIKRRTSFDLKESAINLVWITLNDKMCFFSDLMFKSLFKRLENISWVV